jgi:uncharacterized membrane protein YdjX (TVP38/TMEM64 family)
VSVGRFAWTTAVGFLPLTAAVAYLGSQAQSLSANNPIVWIAALLIIGLLAAGRLAAIKQSQKPPPPQHGSASPPAQGPTSDKAASS